MALFKGTFNEFYEWAKYRTSYWITQETQKKRRKLQPQDGCSRCHRKDVPLTAAHITPRKDVVRGALNVVSDVQEIELDLADAWAKIKAAHRPFEERFQYLCQPCHREVDAPPEKAEL